MRISIWKGIVDTLLIFISLPLIIFSYKNYIFYWIPSEAARMLGYYHFSKKAILQYNSFPHFLWGWGYIRYTYEQFFTYEYFSMPETPLLTPFIFLYFIPDIVISEKISLALHLIIGIFGIFALGKHFKFSKLGTILWVIIFFLSDNIVSQYNSGHINWKTLYLFPWVFYFYLKSFENKNYLFPAVFMNLMIFFEGGIHILIWINLFIGLYSILIFFESRRILYFIELAKFYLFSFLVGSIKIIPMLHFFRTYKPPEATPDPRGGIAPPYTLKDLFTALTTPNWGAEYANYIGIPLIILFIFAIFFGMKANRPALFTSLFFVLLTVRFDSFSLFYIVRKFPILETQRIPPRYFVMGLFGLGLLSALFITHFQKKMKRTKTGLILFHIFLLLFIIFIYLDLNKVCSAWQRGTASLEIPDFPIYFTSNPKLIPEGKCIQKYSYPNHRIWKIKVKEESRAVFEGLDWRLYKRILKFRLHRGGRYEEIKSKPYNGHISLAIPRGSTKLEMKYNSPYFKVGLVISALSLFSMFFLYFHKNILDFKKNSQI